MKTIATGMINVDGKGSNTHIEDCQIPGYERIAEGEVVEGSLSLARILKRTFARPWNYSVKPQLKRFVRKLYAWSIDFRAQDKPMYGKESSIQEPRLQSGDRVRVRAKEEIESMLDPFKEQKGCAFLETMWQYCGTTQRVLQPVERFLDERDYKVKKASRIVLLEGVLCHGTPVFGRCDRCCHLFWREEWLEKL